MGDEPNRSVAVDGNSIYFTDTDIFPASEYRGACSRSVNVVALEDDMTPQVMRSSCVLDLRASDDNLVGSACAPKCRVLLWPKGGGERQIEVERISGLAADAQAAYWTDDTHVWRLPYAEENPHAIASDQPAPFDIVVRAGVAYWTNFAGGSVAKKAVTGGKVVMLAQGLDHPSQIAIDDRYVYFITGYQPSRLVLTGSRERVEVRGQGSVSRVPVGGGNVEPLATDRDTPKHVTVLDGSAYFLERANAGTGALMQWHPGKGLRPVDAGREVLGLTAGASDLVLSTSDGLYRIPASKLK